MTSETRHAIRVTKRLSASPERVFDAWLDPWKARQFLFTAPGGKVVRADIDGKIGGSFTIVDRREDGDIEHVGTYEVINRPKRIVFTFAVPKFSAEFTRVTVDVAPDDTGSTLTLTHEGVLPEWESRTESGWKMILDSLERTLG